MAVEKASVEYFLENYGAIPENTNFGIKSSITKNFLDTYGVPYKLGNNRNLPSRELSDKISHGTVFLECYMTQERLTAIIEAGSATKTFFNEVID